VHIRESEAFFDFGMCKSREYLRPDYPISRFWLKDVKHTAYHWMSVTLGYRAGRVKSKSHLIYVICRLTASKLRAKEKDYE
jgi:hypothetical protein